MTSIRPGRFNSLADVAGLRVGHHTITDDGHLTGTTVILSTDPAGFAAGADVRGGGPGTRETDLLAPTATIERVTAITLTGGSAYGLASAGGVAEELADRGYGFPVGDRPGEIVPIVPAAVLFDLGRGGRFRATPGELAGRLAVRDALQRTASAGDDGNLGAGAGAVTANLKGGVGSASAVLPDGTVVAALVAVNAIGSPVDQRTGELYGARHLLPGDADGLTAPTGTELTTLLAAAAPRHLGTDTSAASAIRNTTIGVVATDALLTKAGCTKLAAVGHDGLARALHPVHLPFDGDTLFGISTGDRTPGDLQTLFTAAADAVTRAVVRAVLAARAVTTPAGTWLGYLDLAPGALRQG